jgi:hypothetical protein
VDHLKRQVPIINQLPSWAFEFVCQLPCFEHQSELGIVEHNSFHQVRASARSGPFGFGISADDEFLLQVELDFEFQAIGIPSSIQAQCSFCHVYESRETKQKRAVLITVASRTPKKGFLGKGNPNVPLVQRHLSAFSRASRRRRTRILRPS